MIALTRRDEVVNYRLQLKLCYKWFEFQQFYVFPACSLPGSGVGSQCNNSQVEGEDSGLCRGSSDLFTRWGVLLSYIHLYTSASRAHNGANLPINKHYTFCETRGEIWKM